MKTTSKTLDITTCIIILLIILFIILIIKYNKKIEHFETTDIEHFESPKSNNRGKLYILQNSFLQNIENKLLGNGNNILNELNIDPITKIPLDTIGNKTYKKYPINIILYPQHLNTADNSNNINNINNVHYTYLAIFNDGALYKKDNLSKSHWEGPLMNSYYNDKDLNKFIPFRNITLDENGRLLGVGYDGNIYIKISNNEKKHTLEAITNTAINYKYDESYKNNW